MSKKTAGALLISTRLMPVMNNEGQDIMEAFESRGVPVSHGRLMERVRAASHMVFPLLYSSMDRGIAVAESMETRGFPARWKQKREILNTVDRLQISSCIGSVLLLSALSVTGVGEADYYSVPSIMSGFSIAAVVVVFVLNIPYFLLSWRGKVASNQGSEIPV
ncbi:MAG: energy-coupling factor transporter transmembrane protein EcfT [Candidatus Thermoplasmatota archaeon]|nr:energy-coupling factor transporter transmembrane protein EcfT [Candidatus Thermoplasmatota archaeon]